MIWLTLRQFRAAAIATIAALVVLVVFLAASGPALHERYSSLLSTCARQSCSSLAQQLFHQDRAAWLALTALVLVAPALIGSFWGAPLVAREIETGTHALAWNQGITRRHWLIVKLSVVMPAALLTTAICTFAVAWWSLPIDEAAMADFATMDPVMFAARGVAPGAYAVFAFALGVTVGIHVRRTLPAMAITIALFVIVQLLFPVIVRPHLVAPVDTVIEIVDDNSEGFGIERVGPDSVAVNPADTGAWFLSSEIVDAEGHAVDSIPVSVTGPCVAIAQDRNACLAEMNQLGYRIHVIYQPASHFWPMQSWESAIYLGAGLAIAGFSVWRIRRNVT